MFTIFALKCAYFEEHLHLDESNCTGCVYLCLFVARFIKTASGESNTAEFFLCLLSLILTSKLSLGNKCTLFLL